MRKQIQKFVFKLLKKQNPDCPTGGSFAELERLNWLKDHIPAHIPCLEMYLYQIELKLGRKLNEQEYYKWRNKCPAILMLRSDFAINEIRTGQNSISYEEYLQIKRKN